MRESAVSRRESHMNGVAKNTRRRPEHCFGRHQHHRRQTMNAQPMSRRMMLGFIGGSTVAACTVGVQGPAFATNGVWETRAGQLEEASGMPYSAADEGKWTGKSGSHVATVKDNGDGTVTASCTHPVVDADTAAMPAVGQHLITTMYARDVETNSVLHLVEFVTRG